MNYREIVIYQNSKGSISIDVRLEQETVWLTYITEHIGNIFKEGKLNEKVVCRNFRHTAQHSIIRRKKTKNGIEYYNPYLNIIK